MGKAQGICGVLGEDSYLNSFLKHLDYFYLISGFWVALNAVLDETTSVMIVFDSYTMCL